MPEAEQALLDLHLRNTPAAASVEALARDGLVRIIAGDEWRDLERHRRLREQTTALQHEAFELRTTVMAPWRWRWRARRVDAMDEAVDQLGGESRFLRARLHELGLARETPEEYAPLADGRYAALTDGGVDRLYAWMYSEAFDPLIDAGPLRAAAEACMVIYARMLEHWRVAYPPPVLATTAAMLCEAPPDRRDGAVDTCIAIFDRWRRGRRTRSADRILVAAPIALACAAHEDPEQAVARAEEMEQALYELDFPRDREILWGAAMLLLHGFGPAKVARVREVWKRLIAADWAMGASTCRHAARLAQAQGTPGGIGARVERIYNEFARHVHDAGPACAVAASVLGQSDLHPTVRNTDARVPLAMESVYAHMVARALALAGSMPEPDAEMLRPDHSIVAGAVVARLPGSVARVAAVVEQTRRLLREVAGLPVARGPGGDPLTGAALLLCDRAWHGLGSTRLFAFEACAASGNQAWDESTIFRLAAPPWPVWRFR